MTLSQRNRYFKAGIGISLVSLLAFCTQAANLLPLYPELTGGAAKRAAGLFGQLAARYFPATAQVPFAVCAAAIIYALAASILIYFFFEKTHAPEILFFGLFAFSLVFEAFRFMAPLRILYKFPAVFLIFGSRLLFFGRFTGSLTLFAASIYAAGFEQQKQGTLVFATAIATLIVSLEIPVDVFSWDFCLVMISAYSDVFRRAEIAIQGIAIISFFIAASVRGTAGYLVIALGALFAVLGRNLFIGADTWAAAVSGFILLCAGTWLVIERLHRVYLWL